MPDLTTDAELAEYIADAALEEAPLDLKHYPGIASALADQLRAARGAMRALLDEGDRLSKLLGAEHYEASADWYFYAADARTCLPEHQEASDA